eukprot:gb/GECG01005500.1/.p1 GENE.gb/GECG01005500.1/~~gb/GECG01005500.1/.p1  ORF type:complete len:742 (+),score=108.54 gb/GECG01005500.1/:1-2226(+)
MSVSSNGGGGGGSGRSFRAHGSHRSEGSKKTDEFLKKVVFDYFETEKLPPTEEIENKLSWNTIAERVKQMFKDHNLDHLLGQSNAGKTKVSLDKRGLSHRYRKVLDPKFAGRAKLNTQELIQVTQCKIDRQDLCSLEPILKASKEQMKDEYEAVKGRVKRQKQKTSTSKERGNTRPSPSPVTPEQVMEYLKSNTRDDDATQEPNDDSDEADEEISIAGSRRSVGPGQESNNETIAATQLLNMSGGEASQAEKQFARSSFMRAFPSDIQDLVSLDGLAKLATAVLEKEGNEASFPLSREEVDPYKCIGIAVPEQTARELLRCIDSWFYRFPKSHLPKGISDKTAFLVGRALPDHSYQLLVGQRREKVRIVCCFGTVEVLVWNVDPNSAEKVRYNVAKKLPSSSYNKLLVLEATYTSQNKEEKLVTPTSKLLNDADNSELSISPWSPFRIVGQPAGLVTLETYPSREKEPDYTDAPVDADIPTTLNDRLSAYLKARDRFVLHDIAEQSPFRQAKRARRNESIEENSPSSWSNRRAWESEEARLPSKTTFSRSDSTSSYSLNTVRPLGLNDSGPSADASSDIPHAIGASSNGYNGQLWDATRNGPLSFASQEMPNAVSSSSRREATYVNPAPAADVTTADGEEPPTKSTPFEHQFMEYVVDWEPEFTFGERIIALVDRILERQTTPNIAELTDEEQEIIKLSEDIRQYYFRDKQLTPPPTLWKLIRLGRKISKKGTTPRRTPVA